MPPQLVDGSDPLHFAAIGDSFTEGVGDPWPDGTMRGWADRVAAGLAAARSGPVQYANLAVRGRLLSPIVTDQLDAALSLDPLPDLLLMNGGGNDMMRPKTDVAGLVALTVRAVDRMREAGVTPVLLSGADPTTRLPFGRTMHERAAELTRLTMDIARGQGILFVNVFGDGEITRAGYWSEDRIHLNSYGHRRAASIVLSRLGVAVEEFVLPGPDHPTGRRDHAQFAAAHLAPWVGRRLTRRSSGDGRAAKYPAWSEPRT